MAILEGRQLQTSDLLTGSVIVKAGQAFVYPLPPIVPSPDVAPDYPAVDRPPGHDDAPDVPNTRPCGPWVRIEMVFEVAQPTCFHVQT